MDILLLLFSIINGVVIVAVATAYISKNLKLVLRELCLCVTQENPNEKSVPEFLKTISDLEVVAGDSVKLRCKVKGYPQPRVQWYKDGKRIISSDQCSIGLS